MPGHDPYHPSERQQRQILSRQPGRATVLVGEPATVASLRQHWTETTAGEDPADFAAYVARRATLALDRAEYRLLGPRYKTPSLVKEEILSSRRFRSGLRTVRRGPDEAPPSLAEAGQILDELAAGWSRRLIDIMPTLGRLIFQRGFDPQIDYDESPGRTAARGDGAAPVHLLVVAPVEPRQPRAHRRDAGDRDCRPRTCSGASTWRSGRWAPSCGGPE